jgi:hypothetical protein
VTDNPALTGDTCHVPGNGISYDLAKGINRWLRRDLYRDGLSINCERLKSS